MSKQFIIPTRQMTIVSNAMQTPKTMLQVARETGIERANICRYVKRMKDEKIVFPLHRGLCPISKARARFYTTNKTSAWTLFVQRLNPIWGTLCNEDTMKMWEAIKAYVSSQYDPRSVSVPERLQNTWNDKVKQAIDNMVL